MKQPKEQYVAITGREVKLSCRVETAPSIAVEYHWFKCEPDTSGKQPTECFENEMTLAANVTNEGHYVCNITPTAHLGGDSIISNVACVEVVNSTEITVEPDGQLPKYLECSDELVLEFKASCKNYPIRYQWYCNGKELPGGTESTLIINIPSIAEDNIGSYYCEASSDYSENLFISNTCQVQWS